MFQFICQRERVEFCFCPIPSVIIAVGVFCVLAFVLSLLNRHFFFLSKDMGTTRVPDLLDFGILCLRSNTEADRNPIQAGRAPVAGIAAAADIARTSRAARPHRRKPPGAPTAAFAGAFNPIQKTIGKNRVL